MTHKKVYVEIVQRIREIIEQDGLTIGDKIPSERELAARLSVGRSSVREALRSLELLGLIETRIGGGTFIRDFGEHRLVQLVGTFILLDDKTKKDLIETKGILEKEAIRKAISSQASLEGLEKIVSQFPSKVTIQQIEVFNKALIDAFGNNLVLRVWSVSNDYFLTMFPDDFAIEKNYFESIMTALKQRKEDKALEAYKQLTDIYEAL
ncbi:MAG: FadR/GntR family transcriptional regulator [Bacillaceae bacterium]